jgi:hypothetical protein
MWGIGQLILHMLHQIFGSEYQGVITGFGNIVKQNKLQCISKPHSPFAIHLIVFDVQVMTSHPAEPGTSSMVMGKEALGSTGSVRPLGLPPMKNAQAIWHPFV